MDITSSTIKLKKYTFQTRYSKRVVLVRLDMDGPPHRNPDGTKINCPHIHVYREGYDDKWAYPLPSDKFSNPADVWKTMGDFMDYCNIIGKPEINKGTRPHD